MSGTESERYGRILRLEVEELRLKGIRPEPEFLIHLDGSPLCVSAGDCVLVEAESGLGKTTLLDALALRRKPERSAKFHFWPPDADKQDLWDEWNRRELLFNRLRRKRQSIQAIRNKHIAYLGERSRLVSFLTLEKNVRLGITRSTTVTREDIDSLTGSLELTKELLRKRPGELNRNHRQAGLVARTLVSKPTLILVDNPTAGVNRKTKDLIWKTLLNQVDSGSALVAVAQKGELDKALGRALPSSGSRHHIKRLHVYKLDDQSVHFRISNSENQQ